MKKYSALILFGILIFCAFKISAEDETSVFKSLKCGICHKPDTGRAYPSLKEIAGVYNGDSAQLEKYLKGNADPVVDKEKGNKMEKYIEKTKALSEDEMTALVGFILKHKE